MPWIDAFAPIEAVNKAIVMNQTWGHLAPEPNKVYPAKMLFTQSETGDLVVIRSGFGDLPSSPWLFADMQEFVARYAKEPGEIYCFIGTYAKFENGNSGFHGKISKLVVEV